MQWQPFGAADRGIIALNDADVGGHGRKRFDQQLLTLVHSKGERLKHKITAKAIHDDARQAVAFAPDQSAETGVDPASGTIFRRLLDATLKEIQVEVLFPSRKAARHDLGFGIVNGAADEMVASVL